jgi:hypothetical protein
LPSHARFLLQLFDELTFRQLVALAVISEARDEIALGPDARPADVSRFWKRWHELRYGPRSQTSVLDPGVLHELDDLGNRNLIGVVGKDDPPTQRSYEPTVTSQYQLWAPEDDKAVWESSSDRVRVTPRGRQLVELAGLRELPPEEIEAFLEDAWQPDPRDPTNRPADDQ